MLFPFYISYLWSSGVKRNSESEHFRKTYALKNSSKCSSSVYEIFVEAENRLTYSFPLASRQNVSGLKKETVNRSVARQVREFDRSQTQGLHTMPCCLEFDLKKRSKSIITFLNWILSLKEVGIVFRSLTNRHFFFLNVFININRILSVYIFLQFSLCDKIWICAY